jgi:hypothetical protein
MLRRGVVLVALLIGCTVGVAVREVVFPVRAGNLPGYAYKVVAARDLIATVKRDNPAFKDADGQVALEEGLTGFGRTGWRYAGCLQSATLGWGSAMCDHLIFEIGVGSGPPPARTEVIAPPPPPPSPPPAMRH